MFHLQTGIGNKLFHLQIGIRNKTALHVNLVLNDQLGNKVFDLQIGTQNKTVLNDQFWNNLFHAQMQVHL